jgi:hypothetical protein
MKLLRQSDEVDEISHYASFNAFSFADDLALIANDQATVYKYLDITTSVFRFGWIRSDLSPQDPMSQLVKTPVDKWRYRVRFPAEKREGKKRKKNGRKNPGRSSTFGFIGLNPWQSDCNST